MIQIEKPQALFLRFKRQNLIEQDHTPYDELFRLMSPVPTKYWVEPGSPPAIEGRFTEDDRDLNNRRRENRTIIKGRFRGGNVGYIFQDELPLHRAAYKKDVNSFNETDELVLETIRQEGAMNIALIKEITGLLSKQISSSLQKMQKAFIVYEDQVDGENDRAFYILEDEFFQMDFSRYNRIDAVCELIKRFCYLNVLVDKTMIRSFTGLPQKIIREALERLISEKSLLPIQTGGEENLNYILRTDQESISSASSLLPGDIFILDLNDYYVKSQELTIRERFSPKPYKILRYIMYRGEFIGALLGYFRFGPDDLEDVILDLPDKEKISLGPKIIQAIYTQYNPRENVLKRFDGKPLS
jgi:hypothetical protein